MNCGNEMKMKKWSSQWTQFMQFRKEPWKKFRTSTGFEPVTSRYRCDALPTELWSHWRWEQFNCGFICSRERNEASLRNCINCVHCDDHFFIFVEVIVDRKVLFHGWLIYSYLHIFKLIKCKWLPGECADWFFNNIMTWSCCLHRRYSMSRQKNSILINEHALNHEPVPLKGTQLRK